ncbi:hypothetical protein EHRUM1_05690, partial [Ehrlichia ruminantium]
PTHNTIKTMAGVIGLEPITASFGDWCSIKGL